MTEPKMTPIEGVCPPQPEIDWKKLAYEAGGKLAWAVSRLKAPGLMFSFSSEGESVTKTWEDDVIETLLKFPGAKVDRDGIMEKYLTPKEREKLRKTRAKEKK